MNKILLSILAVWSIFGLILFWSMFFKSVKKQPQKIVFFILCGPIYWIVSPIVIALDFVAEKIFGPIHNWLTKE